MQNLEVVFSLSAYKAGIIIKNTRLELIQWQGYTTHYTTQRHSNTESSKRNLQVINKMKVLLLSTSSHTLYYTSSCCTSNKQYWVQRLILCCQSGLTVLYITGWRERGATPAETDTVSHRNIYSPCLAWLPWHSQSPQLYLPQRAVHQPPLHCSIIISSILNMIRWQLGRKSQSVR